MQVGPATASGPSLGRAASLQAACFPDLHAALHVSIMAMCGRFPALCVLNATVWMQGAGGGRCRRGELY